MRSTLVGPADARWRAVLARTTHDFYHLPEYTALTARYENAEPLAFYAEDRGSQCLIPVLVRSLPAQLGAPANWCDLTSAYGYPAPLYTDPSDTERILAFNNAFRAATAEIGASSAFLRLHPLFEFPAGLTMTLSAVRAHGETVSIDLTQSEEEMWRQTRLNHRGDIRRLEQLKFTPVMDDWSLFNEFIRVYQEAMARLGADPFYSFSGNYFHELRTAVGDQLHLCAVISSDGRLAAGALFTTVSGIMEYHLAATQSEFQRLAPNKLLLHFARLWGKRYGCSICHLGGGVGCQNDTLLLFKAGFSRARHEFSTWRIIACEQRYATLTLRAGLPLNPAEDLHSDYFPPYRGVNALH